MYTSDGCAISRVTARYSRPHLDYVDDSMGDDRIERENGMTSFGYVSFSISAGARDGSRDGGVKVGCKRTRIFG